MREHAERLLRAHASMASRRAGAESWSGEVAPGEWGPGHVLAHAAEMLPYWMGEIERVLDDPRTPAPFGRTQSDPVRLQTIERDHTLPVRELYARIAIHVERVAARLLELGGAEVSRRCVHSTLGEMTVGGLVDEFLSGHLEEHARQLEAALAVGAR